MERKVLSWFSFSDIHNKGLGGFIDCKLGLRLWRAVTIRTAQCSSWSLAGQCIQTRVPITPMFVALSEEFSASHNPLIRKLKSGACPKEHKQVEHRPDGHWRNII